MATMFTGVTREEPSDEPADNRATLRLLMSGDPSAQAVVTGGTGDDTLTGTTGDDDVDGGAGADRMTGGLGDDIYHVDNAGDVVVERPNEGNDSVYTSVSYSLAGQFIENLYLLCGADINGTGNKLDNLLFGNCGINILSGGDGSDTLDGQGGADTMYGGAGDDYYYVENAGDVVIEVANEGHDTVYSSITYSLVAQYIEDLILSGTDAINGTGNSLNNIIIGNDGANTLDGMDGDDEIFGGAGVDTMIGGNGNDIFHVDDLGDTCIETSYGGYDKVFSSVSYSLGGQYIEDIELTGNGSINAIGNKLDNRMTGNSGNNTLNGGAGNDIIDGGAGADTMRGSVGDDTFYVDDAGDTVIEQNGEGYDQVFSSVGFSLSGQYIENLTLIGSATINGTGNKLDNYLTGNSAANTLSGGEGNDTIDGGDGADTMIGGLGDDIFYVDQAGDSVVEASNEGYDAVYATVSYSLAGQYIEDLYLEGTDAIDGTGNSLSNIIFGNDAANVIDGREGDDLIDGGEGNDTIYGGDGADLIDGWIGADTMYGGAGDDAFYVDDAGDVVIEYGNQGLDVVFSEVSFSLAGQYIEALYLMCGADIDGTGNSLDNLLLGNCGANVLMGMDGNDEIDGDSGIDTMYGGKGDDVIYVDDLGDLAIEYAHEGYDTVISSISYSLAGQYIEALILQCGDDIDGTGNSLANTLIGNCGDNVLSGMDGDDKIFGDDGYDTLVGGAGADGFYFDTIGDGTYDTITDFAVGTDTIQIDMTVFDGFSVEGVLDAGAFVSGTAALDADDRILYDITTGELWYDVDGDGAEAAVLFAQVAAGTALSAADFNIYDGDTLDPFSAAASIFDFGASDDLSTLGFEGGGLEMAFEDPAFSAPGLSLSSDSGEWLGLRAVDQGPPMLYAQLPMGLDFTL